MSPSRPTRLLRVLVVEDTPANQKVITALLVNRGHDVAVASTGAEGVSVFREGEFDVVLMDVQMPGIDGLQACRMMRESERGAARATTIIAMTAHAMSEDRGRCLDAGMDDYLAKPVGGDELIATVEKHARRPTPAAPAPTDSRGPGAQSPVDFERALSRFGGDEELFRDAVGFFLEDAPELADQLDRSSRAEDFPEARRAAHSLKGLLASLDAAHAATLARQAEQAAEAGDVAALRAVGLELAGSLEEVVLAARDLLGNRHDDVDTTT